MLDINGFNLAGLVCWVGWTGSSPRHLAQVVVYSQLVRHMMHLATSASSMNDWFARFADVYLPCKPVTMFLTDHMHGVAWE